MSKKSEWDQLDESPKAGLVFDRGFWRHPITKAAMVVMPDGRKKQLRSPSGDFKNHLDETTNLEKWKQRQIVLGLAYGFDIDLGLPSGDKAQRQALDSIITKALDDAGANVAADQGTHTHLTTELDDEGAHWLTIAAAGGKTGLPDAVQLALVEVWRELLHTSGLEILDVELTVANDVGAGTLDRIARTTKDMPFTLRDGRKVQIPKGTIIVLDIKTGQLRTDAKGHPNYWVGYAHQIGHYATARPVTIDPDDADTTVWHDWEEFTGHGPPSTKHALIAHLDVRGALEGHATGRLIYVDLTDYEPMSTTIRDVRHWRKAKPMSVVGEPDAVVNCAPAGAPVTEERRSWLQGRINLLGMTDEGRPLLAKHWPKGVAPLAKNPDITPDEFDQIITLVDRVEAKIGAPFGDADPATPTGVTHADMKAAKRQEDQK